MSRKTIKIVGAREHNLKNVTVEIPKESLTIITGPSGSGKSSLALDVLYAEGQRRYMESLSSYARQFLGMPKKPDVDQIQGLCPAIAIEQKTVGANPRSTVGTITEIYDYLRVLFARIGKAHCPTCAAPIEASSPDKIAETIMRNNQGATIVVMAPIAREKKGEFTAEFEKFFTDGYYRFMVDGTKVILRSADDIKKLDLKKSYKHTIDIIIDTIELPPEEITQDELPRLTEALERAFGITGTAKVITNTQEQYYSTKRMCLTCDRSIPEIEPRLFSFNSPVGACATCHGLGMIIEVPWNIANATVQGLELADRYGMYQERPCMTCTGKRLNDIALSVTVGDKNIYEVSELTITKALNFFETLPLSDYEAELVDRLRTEIQNRYRFLQDVGLGYLTLNRTARTLSGGEGQRIRLATQIGSSLSGVVYVLDEPSIGLHQRDNDRLIATLKTLRDQGNTVVVVEHDHDTMLSSDYIIDMGPAAGILGGTVVATGTPQDLQKNPESLTGKYLSGELTITRGRAVRSPSGFMQLNNATEHNLKNISVQFPLGVLCAVSGVSGSGKSSLVMYELVDTMEKVLRNRRFPLEISKVTGTQSIENMVVIDQSPIGRTSRSNPATYLGLFDDIRKLFASLPESNARGYNVGRFSFNVGEGRCKECNGDGSITVSMHFLPDVVMQCPRCKGQRYNAQTLQITFKNKNIADILSMTAREALDFFAAHTALAKRIQLMCDVGLDYLQLGQPSTTLSGGEAQRIKLVDELAKRGKNTLYVLDEPTTGLHSHDIARLLKVLNQLVDKGNSLIVIEHNIDVLKTADYIIDMGPEGGDAGGMIVAQGTPEEVAQCPTSFTGQYLRKALS